MIQHHMDQAANDFNRVRIREAFSRLLSFADPDRRNMLSLDEVKELLKPKTEIYLGMRTVPVDRIVGSEGRYRDFNRRFLPRYEYLRSRWMRVDMANIQDLILPPIKLYELGGLYFVRDGNHRVSVAKVKGVQDIDAEVVSLGTEIALDGSMSRQDILKSVIRWERERFLEKTGYGRLFPPEELEFSEPGRFDEIVQHIFTHKYFINQNYRREIPLDKAIASWHYNVFKPIIDIIREEGLLLRFPGRTAADLYVWIVGHWDALKQKYGDDYSMVAAARDYAHRYGRGVWVQFLDGLYGLFLAISRRIF
jgi:hypothetical protein